MNKRSSVLFMCLLLASSCSASATTRYIAQMSGTFSGGTACNGQTAITPSAFNGITNSPGDVNYICGTITGNAGAVLLTPQGNGSAASPVEIIFDSGADLRAPYFAYTGSGCGGAICLDGLSYYVIDGQNMGTIENTANGTGLSYHADTVGIQGWYASNITIENLTIANMYTHTATGDTAVDQSRVFFVAWSGPSWTIQNNILHDAGFGLYEQPINGDSATISGNTEYNVDHGIALAFSFSGGSSGPFLIHGNTIYGYDNWDTGIANAYHHDGLHCWDYASNPGVGAHITALAIYNNTFGTPVGGNINEQIFLEDGTGQSGATPCADSTSNVYIFNNIIASDSTAGTYCSDNLGMNNGIVGLFSAANYTVVNNTIISSDSPSDTCSAGPHVDAQPTSLTFKNNAISGFNSLINYCPGESSCGAPFVHDYNQYANGGDNAFVWQTIYLGTSQFSLWQSDSGGDGHAAYNSTLDLNGSYQPNTGSPLIGAGENLTSLCSGYLAPLCLDYAGNPRPATGNWTVGAYQSSSEGNNGTLSEPTFSPVSPYSGSSTTVTISGPSGATILYCTDTSNSCTPSTTYTAPLDFTSTEYIRAQATESNYTSSSIAVWQGTPNNGTLSEPTFSPASPYSGSSTTVTISGPSGATILYCTDTSNSCTPSTTYTAPLDFTSTEYIRAQATESNYTSSSIAVWQGTPSSSGLAVSYVQSATGNSSYGGTSGTATLPAATTAGNSIVACASWNSASNTGVTVAFGDSQGQTYTTDASTRIVVDSTQDYAEIGAECGHSTTATTSTTDTITCTYSNGVNGFCTAFEVNPGGGLLTLDRAATSQGINGPTLSAGPITPSQDDTLGLFVAAIDIGNSGQPTFTPGSGWSNVGASTAGFGGGDFYGVVEYNAPLSTSAVSASSTITSYTYYQWIGTLANYKSTSSN